MLDDRSLFGFIKRFGSACLRRAVEDGKLLDRLDLIYKERWIMCVGIDPYNTGVLSKELEQRRIRVSMVAQHIRSLNATTKQVRDLAVRRRLKHRGVEFLNWQVANSKLYKDVNENHKVVKEETAPYRKIDSVIALLCAMKVAEDHGVVECRSDVRYIPL